MDAAHRAALLTASCLRTPVNPRTRAPLALYERERRPPAAAEQQVLRGPSPPGGRDWLSLLPRLLMRRGKEGFLL
uniref:Uncharacterized protein n=1 Tax=Terrapene triunguis TaxID=2587831 RepID=A0A674JBF7_9SAUR